jgi:hypothetical protein
MRFPSFSIPTLALAAMCGLIAPVRAGDSVALPAPIFSETAEAPVPRFGAREAVPPPPFASETPDSASETAPVARSRQAAAVKPVRSGKASSVAVRLPAHRPSARQKAPALAKAPVRPAPVETHFVLGRPLDQSMLSWSTLLLDRPIVSASR